MTSFDSPSPPTGSPDLEDPPVLCQTATHACDACGAPLCEVDRRQEGGTLYVWYECVDPACSGQWLDHLACW